RRTEGLARAPAASSLRIPGNRSRRLRARFTLPDPRPGSRGGRALRPARRHLPRPPDRARGAGGPGAPRPPPPHGRPPPDPPLPTLVSWAARERAGWERGLGLLYGLNTLGAVVGAALAGFALVPTLGLSATTTLVAVLALAVGATMAGVAGATLSADKPDEPAG